MKVTAVLILAIFGMVSAGEIDDSNPHGQNPITIRHFGVGAVKLDGNPFIFKNGILIMQGYFKIGVPAVYKILSGYLTTETGLRVSVDGGFNYFVSLHPRNTEAIRSAFSRVDITLEDFLQRTGTSSPMGVYEVLGGVISINGTYMNINAGVTFLLMMDLMEPKKKSLDTGDPLTPLMRTFTISTAKLDGHAYIFQNSEILLQGSPIEIGEDGVFGVVSGFLTTKTGHRVSVDGGFLYMRALHPRNREAIRRALSRADISLEHFLQQTGTISPKLVFEVTAGVISISGTYRNINAAVIFLLMGVTEPSTGQTVVTETAAPETLTAYQSVTLTKTSTRDEYVTITSPVYNNAVTTFTNFLRRTVTVTEEQVIRSPVAGSVVVNTIPVSTQSVLTVTDTATNYFLSTALRTVTSTLQHFTHNFSFRTITVNNIITSTVVHTITRTSIATAYVTNTVGSTVYSTTDITITISHDPATDATIVPVYF